MSLIQKISQAAIGAILWLASLSFSSGTELKSVDSLLKVLEKGDAPKQYSVLESLTPEQINHPKIFTYLAKNTLKRGEFGYYSNNRMRGFDGPISIQKNFENSQLKSFQIIVNERVLNLDGATNRLTTIGTEAAIILSKCSTDSFSILLDEIVREADDREVNLKRINTYILLTRIKHYEILKNAKYSAMEFSKKLLGNLFQGLDKKDGLSENVECNAENTEVYCEVIETLVNNNSGLLNNYYMNIYFDANSNVDVSESVLRGTSLYHSIEKINKLNLEFQEGSVNTNMAFSILALNKYNYSEFNYKIYSSEQIIKGVIIAGLLRNFDGGRILEKLTPPPIKEYDSLFFIFSNDVHNVLNNVKSEWIKQYFTNQTLEHLLVPEIVSIIRSDRYGSARKDDIREIVSKIMADPYLHSKFLSMVTDGVYFYLGLDRSENKPHADFLMMDELYANIATANNQTLNYLAILYLAGGLDKYDSEFAKKMHNKMDSSSGLFALCKSISLKSKKIGAPFECSENLEISIAHFIKRREFLDRNRTAKKRKK